MKIGVVSTGGALLSQVEEMVQALISEHYAGQVELIFHPQCFLQQGHFAGSDEVRLRSFVEVANDPAYDVVWFGRGGYGSFWGAGGGILKIKDLARRKIYMGYSDAGVMLAALYKHKIGSVFHGPMPGDILREQGDKAVRRGLDFFLTRDRNLVEASVDNCPTVAFNMMTLSQMIDTSILPNLSGHIVMVEEVGEYMYRIDRVLGHITSSSALKNVAGLCLGRCNLVPENAPVFGQTEEEIARFWCAKNGLPFLGRADIGHDIDNKIVPFGCF
jgi:muramoyltetrapeptide carboxypeptidase